MPLAFCLGEEGEAHSSAPTPSRKQNGEAGVSCCGVLAVVSLFLSCLNAYPAISRPVRFRLPLLRLVGELGSSLLPGVHFSSCILICVLAHSLHQK